MNSTRKLTKQQLIDTIVQDIKENPYDWKDFLYDVVDDHLDTLSFEQLFMIYGKDEIEEIK